MLMMELFAWIVISAVVVGVVIIAEVWLASRRNRYIGGILPVVLLLVCVFFLLDGRNSKEYTVWSEDKEYSFQSEEEFKRKIEELKMEQVDFSVKQTIFIKEERWVAILSGMGTFVLFAIYIYIRKKKMGKKELYKMRISDL